MARGGWKKNQQIGPWTLVSRLGGGGNGEVWKAKDVRQRLVALKILKNQRHESEPLSRFRTEERILRELSSIEGIVPLIDSDTNQLPAWIALEIAECLHAKERIAFGEVVKLIADIANTLSELADKSVFHRDIKPANLFRYCGRGAVSDFGLATFPDKESVTAGSKKLGPVYYIAPEMLNQPTAAQAGPADVYSLAKSLWVLGAGQNYPLPGQLIRSFEPYRIGTWVDDPRAWLLEEVLESATDPAPERRPTMKQFGAKLKIFLEARDTIQPVSILKGLGPQLLGTLVRGKQNQSDLEAKRRDFNKIKEELERLMQPVAASLQEQLGEEFVDCRSNPNHLYIAKTAPAERRDCLGVVITISAGPINSAHSLQLHFGIAVWSEADDFSSLRILAAQLCCRHVDAQLEFVWKDERQVVTGISGCIPEIRDIFELLQKEIHLGLKAFQDRCD